MLQQRAALLTVQDDSALPEAPMTPESYDVQTSFAARLLGYITMSDLEQREALMYAASYDLGLAALDNSEEHTCTVGEIRRPYILGVPLHITVQPALSTSIPVAQGIYALERQTRPIPFPHTHRGLHPIIPTF